MTYDDLAGGDSEWSLVSGQLLSMDMCSLLEAGGYIISGGPKTRTFVVYCM